MAKDKSHGQYIFKIQPLLLTKKHPIVLFILAISLVINFYFLISDKEELKFIINNSRLPYDQRLKSKLGSPLFDFIQYAQNNLPPDAVIALPPSGPAWPNTSSGLYMNYFLYPRKLVRPESVNHPPPASATHVFLIWGEVSGLEQDQYLWPRKDYPPSQVTLIQEKPPWGIINLQND